MEENNVQTIEVQAENFICPNCGGAMRHDIKKNKFLCTACGYEGALHTEDNKIDEHDFNGYAALEAQSVLFVGLAVANCQNCGKEITFEKNATATTCPMCGSTQISLVKQKAGIPPEGLIPFKVDKQEAGQKFREWVKSLWFAPNKLKKTYQAGNLTGRFVPFWTYDADSVATYTGEGGKYRKVKDKDGKEHTVTDWYSASGVVRKSFNDILIVAATGDSARDADCVGPFDTIRELRPYAPEYLAGYQAELYTIKADAGFETAKGQMESTLLGMANDDIHVRFDTARSVKVFPKYTNVTYKHVLLPVWTSIFGYAGKTFRYVVNGATGKVYGDRPFSAVKITIAILVAVGILFGAFAMFMSGDEVTEDLPAEAVTAEETRMELPSQQIYAQTFEPIEL